MFPGSKSHPRKRITTGGDQLLPSDLHRSFSSWKPASPIPAILHPENGRFPGVVCYALRIRRFSKMGKRYAEINLIICMSLPASVHSGI